jgi:ribose transport system ATP-binding protein
MTGERAPAAEPLLRVRGVRKRYAAPVLTDVDLDLAAGEIHALMGANGAGKSTLSRILCGVTPADAGTLALAGRPYAPTTRRDALRAGVQIVPQEPALLPTLSVAENLFLADLPHRAGVIARRALAQRAIAALEAVGLGALDPWTPAARLGIGQQQLVALASALAHPCRVLILDEPTAALTDAESAIAFEHVRRLAASGTAILYVSHRLEEIQRLCQRLTVLRDGRVVGTRDATATSLDDAVALMVGTAAAGEAAPRAPRTAGPVALRVDGLTRGTRPRGVGFEVRRGEILGLAGLVGSGRTETLRAIVGADRPDAGRISGADGTPLVMHSPRDAVRAGIGLVPEDRRTQALCLSQPIRVNLTLPSLAAFAARFGWIDRGRERRAAEAERTRLAIRSVSIEQPAGELSGGNQQNVVIARWLLRDVDVLLIDEPTRGVDVAAKAAVHAALHELAADGKALVVVSSELAELTALCDRIAVLSDGRLVATFDRETWSETAITAAAFSGYAARPAAAGEEARW